MPHPASYNALWGQSASTQGLALYKDTMSLTKSEVRLPGAASAWMPSSILASRFASSVSRRRFFPCSPLFAVSCPTATKVFARTCTNFTASQQNSWHTALDFVVLAGALNLNYFELRLSAMREKRHACASVHAGESYRLGRLLGALVGVQHIVVMGRGKVHGTTQHIVDF